MGVVASATGTQACTIGTEHFLASPEANGTYTLHLDLSVMTVNDVMEVRIYQKVVGGETARVAYYSLFDGIQPADDAVKISVPISTHLNETNALRFSIKQLTGTGRNVPWTVMRYV